jgi:FixJ family two-component response regulator
MSSDFEDESRLQIAGLGRQEKQILEHLTNGASIRSIAAHIGITNAEAEHIVQQMMEKLAAKRIADLVRMGLEASFALRR